MPPDFEARAREELQHPADSSHCDCIEKDAASGYWMARCYCGNYDDCAGAADWCARENSVSRITAALHAVRREALEDGAQVAFMIGMKCFDASNRAKMAGRNSVASHRQSDGETAARIGKAIRALIAEPEKEGTP